MKRFYLLLVIMGAFVSLAHAQGIPNSGFETWVTHTNYSDPQSWDTPNEDICFFPFYLYVVSKSTDHQSGSFSAKLESKNVPLFGMVVPGAMTLGTFTIDFLSGIYEVTGGVPLTVPVTHLKGFFKYIPKGGDSCVIGIGLSQWKNAMHDSVGEGWFSTKDTVTAWTPFSAWINIDSLATPDSMNVLIMSSASDVATEGTVLYVDGLYLDYTVGTKDERPSAGIEIYNDGALDELDIFLDFEQPQSTQIRLYDLMGNVVHEIPMNDIQKKAYKIPYHQLPKGLYILNVVHDTKSYQKKFLLNP